jgi:hypothetical protein
VIGIRITVAQDTATPALRALQAGIQPGRLAPILGRSAYNATRTHLFAKDATGNRLGGRRTHFYGAAARATNFALSGDAVVVSIPQLGIRQRYYGGTIKPKTAKYLTIPVHPSAHGKRAREFGDLHVLYGAAGPYGLARKDGTMLYRLAKSATQQADTSVLLTTEALATAIRPDLESYLKRLTK